ncbi:hypothetical protein PRZ48_010048 [Zasmidium cellare]|uniref:Uncharacterized protein n=1 Tax=Zasmidium cellare TaxID=395010 RepID=A0ABR0EDG3_ZASCE|nr:hypothetical protein PRZ48_010048 [Zasmidium cellare]
MASTSASQTIQASRTPSIALSILAFLNLLTPIAAHLGLSILLDRLTNAATKEQVTIAIRESIDKGIENYLFLCILDAFFAHSPISSFISSFCGVSTTTTLLDGFNFRWLFDIGAFFHAGLLLLFCTHDKLEQATGDFSAEALIYSVIADLSLAVAGIELWAWLGNKKLRAWLEKEANTSDLLHRCYQNCRVIASCNAAMLCTQPEVMEGLLPIERMFFKAVGFQLARVAAGALGDQIWKKEVPTNDIQAPKGLEEEEVKR